VRQWRSVRPVEAPGYAPFIAADLGSPPSQLNGGSIVVRQAASGVSGVNGSGQRIEEVAAWQLSSQIPSHPSSPFAVETYAASVSTLLLCQERQDCNIMSI
jgi:hypothetical protein